MFCYRIFFLPFRKHVEDLYLFELEI
jgi:hypothetical protein